MRRVRYQSGVAVLLALVCCQAQVIVSCLSTASRYTARQILEGNIMKKLKLKKSWQFVSLLLLVTASGTALADSYQMRIVIPGLRATPAAPAAGSCAAGEVVVSYTGAAQAVAVPSGCTTAFVDMWGAGGGSGNTGTTGSGSYSGSYSSGGNGGGGGYVGFSLSGLPAGQTFSVRVGAGGLAPDSVTFNQGGYYGYAWAGAGGGRSDISLNGTLIAVAGAGGGGGGGDDNLAKGALGGNGGAGGTLAGNAAGNGGAGLGGQAGGASGANGGAGVNPGGSLVGGGCTSSSPNPIFPNGGTFCGWSAGNLSSASSAGAGGDGYVGGGSGYSSWPSTTEGGGGGGSSYVNTGFGGIASVVLLGGSGITPGNASSANRGNAGLGGTNPLTAIGQSGQAGRVVVTFAP
jgi:hypothetical protein